MHLVLHEVGQLEHVDDAHRHRPVKGLTGLAVVEHHLARRRQRLVRLLRALHGLLGDLLVGEVLGLHALVAEPHPQAQCPDKIVRRVAILSLLLRVLVDHHLGGAVTLLLQPVAQPRAPGRVVVRQDRVHLLDAITTLAEIVAQVQVARILVVLEGLLVDLLLGEPVPSAHPQAHPGPVDEPRPGQLGHDLVLVGPVGYGGGHPEAQPVRRPAQMRLQDLADVHAAGNA